MATDSFHPTRHRSSGRHRRPLLVLSIAIALSLPALALPTTSVIAADPGADGQIAWQRNMIGGPQIFTMHSDGTRSRQLTTVGSNWAPAWSPDGRKIAFGSNRDGKNHIYVMDADGEDQTRLTNSEASDEQPTWSGDGSRIAFVSFDGVFGYSDIWVMDADGSHAVNLTNDTNGDSEPTWQPNGSKIAFHSNHGGISDIYVVDADGGGGLVNLTNTPAIDESDPDWSPDGSRIVYARSGVTYVMHADGTSQTRIGTSSDARMPAWSPSGTRILFVSARDSNDELLAMNSDGSKVIRLTNDASTIELYQDWSPAWQPTSLASGPDSIAFGAVSVGKSSTTKNVTLTAGPASVHIDPISVSGDDPTQFSIASETCTQQPIPARGTCSIAVRFTPTSVGAKHALLRIDGPAPVDARTVALSGTGRLFIWSTSTTAGPKYIWNEGNALARTTKGSKTYLHAIYATDRIGSKWANDKGVYAGAYFIRTSNDGSTWSAPKRLNPKKQHGSRTAIASSGSNVYAAWVSTTKWIKYKGSSARVLYFRRNTNHGASSSWKPTIRLTSKTGRVDYPTIAASGASVYVAYTDSSTGKVRLASSANRGSTWKTVTLGLTTNSGSSGKAGYPAIAAGGANIVVAWIDDPSGTVKVRVSADRGATWDAATTIGTSTSVPSVAASGARLGIAWTDGGTRVRVWTGGSWGDVRTLPVTDGYDKEEQQIPVIALTGTASVAVAYSACVDDCDFTSDVQGARRDLIWRASVDGAATWLPSDVVYRNASSTTRRINDIPSIVWPSPNRVYVLWNGWRENTLNYRLYLRVGK